MTRMTKPQEVKDAAKLLLDYLDKKWRGFDYINTPIADPREHNEYELYLYAESKLSDLAK